MVDSGWCCCDSPLWNLLCTSDVELKNMKNGGGFLPSNVKNFFYSIEMYLTEYFKNHLLCVGKKLFSYGWTMCRKKPIQ